MSWNDWVGSVSCMTILWHDDGVEEWLGNYMEFEYTVPSCTYE